MMVVSEGAPPLNQTHSGQLPQMENAGANSAKVLYMSKKSQTKKKKRGLRKYSLGGTPAGLIGLLALAHSCYREQHAKIPRISVDGG